MDNNKTFMFMLSIAIISIGVTWYFFLTNKNKNVQSDTVYNDKVISKKDTSFKNEHVDSQFELIETKQSESYDLIYENKNIKVVFDPNDAIIKNFFVKDTFLKRKEVSMYDLVQGEDKNGSLRLKFGSWENEHTVSSLTGGKNFFNYVREKNVFIFTCSIKKKSEDLVYTIIKKYSFIDDENIFKLDIEIKNNKNIPVNFDNSGVAFSIGWGPLLGLQSRTSKDQSKNRYNNISYLSNNKDVKKIDLTNKDLKNNKFFLSKTKEGNDGWIASAEHYFASIIYPDNQNYKYIFDYRDNFNKNFYSGFARDTRDKSVLKSTFYVYCGPKIGSFLKKYDNFEKEDFLIRGSNFSKIEESIMFGLGNLIGIVLNFIYGIVKNYGFAIIILTVIIKLLLSPLTHQSMVSQEKMSKLQPKMKALQEKYKDKPDLLNKETMSLYKREGINPLSGCLPLVLQMPILIAMYNLLDRMVELKGSNFLWIKDLSAGDAILNFSFTIPFLNISSLNILPIIMTGVSVLSTLFTPNMDGNKQTKMMMWMMPLIFFFMFYNVSSGLVLYWTVMNILNLLQQLYINYLKKRVVKTV
ncbi:MAG TPA: YidC/Oxa1 family insertase periplasmic-domain containing protein [Spirochaetota bacterium]|nr:YidC/Oxa1 family insertase periplasmic-domain containing protein [Spirochaetota bacterium]